MTKPTEIRAWCIRCEDYEIVTHVRLTPPNTRTEEGTLFIILVFQCGNQVTFRLTGIWR